MSKAIAAEIIELLTSNFHDFGNEWDSSNKEDKKYILEQIAELVTIDE